jgi:hypothetical protein
MQCDGRTYGLDDWLLNCGGNPVYVIAIFNNPKLAITNLLIP